MSAKTPNIFVASAVAALLAGSAVAQTTTFDTVDAADDTIETIEENVQDDFDRDVADNFGNSGRELGFTGSIAARATATSGNTENADIGIGARFGYFDGTNGHDVNLAYTYGEESDDVSQNSLLASYDYTRTFTNNVYLFAKLRTSYDEFASFETDTFAGLGAGYRIYNSDDLRWSVQAGPGYRWVELNGGGSFEEEALSVSSDVFARISPTSFITNDTEILASETSTFVTNELGLNVAVTDTLAVRTSVLTEYNTDPEPGFDDTDNTVGMSLVYTFN